MLPSLLTALAGAHVLATGTTPIEKRVNWFTSGDTANPTTQQFLLKDASLTAGLTVCLLSYRVPLLYNECPPLHASCRDARY